MLSFFREFCAAKRRQGALDGASWNDAQRAMPDGAEKRAIATEIARLAESQENAQKAIEQYKPRSSAPMPRTRTRGAR